MNLKSTVLVGIQHYFYPTIYKYLSKTTIKIIIINIVIYDIYIYGIIILIMTIIILVIIIVHFNSDYNP